MPDNNFELKYQAAMRFISFVRGYVEAMIVTSNNTAIEYLEWQRLSEELDIFFTDSYTLPKMSSEEYQGFIRAMNQ